MESYILYCRYGVNSKGRFTHRANVLHFSESVLTEKERHDIWTRWVQNENYLMPEGHVDHVLKYPVNMKIIDTQGKNMEVKNNERS